MPMQISERFWSKVEFTNGCWIWLACKNDEGYGSFKFKGKTYGAHRVAYELAHGEIPADTCVLHRCDNPSCVNPAHLFLGTKRDNTLDAISKGRDRVWQDAARAYWAKMTKAERAAHEHEKLKTAWIARDTWWAERTTEERTAWARRAALARWRKPDANANT